jgi:N-carbamoylputrescine amidase
MSILKIALLQMLSNGPDQEANRAKGEQFCRQAKSLGADIALFPEMWNNGYHLPERSRPEEVPAWHRQAIERDGGFVTHFRELALELDMAIALTYLEKWPGSPRNSLSLIDRHGEIRLTYAKVHTCDFDREAFLTPGDGFYVCELDTAAGPVKVGAMICFDREFPESARILMLKGAEIILTPHACEMEANRLSQLRTRAYENMLGVALANYAAPQENGHSVAFDGIAFDAAGSREHCLVQADGHEGVFMAKFDLERLRAYRLDEVWGNAYRKVDRYDILVSPEVEAPFIRPDNRR